MHSGISAPVRDGDVYLFREHTAAADAGERHIADTITGRVDDDELDIDGLTERTDAVGDISSLCERELTRSRGETQLHRLDEERSGNRPSPSLFPLREGAPP